MQNPPISLLHKQRHSTSSQFINRRNVKFFIRILVGLALAHVIGQRVRPSDAAPSSTKSNWKYRPQKTQSTTPSNERDDDEKTTTIVISTTALSSGASWQPGQLKNCTEPAIDEFPEDLFTQSQRRSGAIIFHFIACLYIFIAIAVVVDDYFISALDKLCAILGLDEDVAGATFMAGGSSSPELFTAIIGIFVAKGDVGVGTIVGSAVFNIVCVIGVCGLFVNAAIRLTWWPLCRDSIYYSLSILILIMCLSDGRITLFESTFLLLMYAGYIAIMCNNQRIRQSVLSRWQVFQTFGYSDEPIINPANVQKTYGAKNTYERFDDDEGQNYNSTPMQQRQAPIDEVIARSRIPIDFETAALKIMMSRYFRNRTRFRMAVRFVISHLRTQHGQGVIRPQKPANERRFSFYQGRTPSLLAADENYDDWKNIPNYNYDPVNFAKWAVTAPIKIIFHFTIPDCRNPRWFKWYPCTFVMSIVWLCLLTYLMVWMVTIIGFTFGIPDSVMGITFLAAGSSVPDAMSSVLVVRQGLVDMGVSNTFGSNVFDLLVGLALPWFFKTLLSGEAVHINSNGLMYDSVLLLGIVALTVISFHRRQWYLDKNLGIFFLGIYGIFVVFSLAIELNVFGFVNPPMC